MVLALQRVDDLLVAGGSERGDGQRLRLAAGEQRRAMSARQHAGADADRTDGAGVAAVDARLARQDLVAHDLRLEVLERAVGGVHGHGVGAFRQHGGHHRLLDLADATAALRLALDAEGFVEVGFGNLSDLGNHGGVDRRRGPVPGFLAGFVGQLVDQVDDSLHLLVAVHHSAQHDVFRQLLSLGLDHQHTLDSAGHHQIHLGGLELGLGRVEDILAVKVTDARGADRTVERDAGQGQGCRGADDGRDVRVDLGVDRQHRRDHLHFVEEAFRE